MKREELDQLLRDQVLATVNGGHLRFNGVHVLTKVNLFLLRLITIGVKSCGKCMNMIYEGLSQTGEDLRVAFLRVACIMLVKKKTDCKKQKQCNNCLVVKTCSYSK